MVEQVRGYPRRRAISARDWTKGNIIGNLLSLYWPMIISSSLNMLGPTVDMIWVGKLGASSVAGVGVAGTAIMVVNSMVMGFFTGMQAMIARFVGAGDHKGAVHVARQALFISAAFSTIMAITGVLFAETILKQLGVAADVVSQGTPYLRIQLVGIVTTAIQMMTNSTMVASGDTMRPMWISIFYRLFHIALCPFLIFGWWLFPRMGVSGAALTGVFSTGLGAAFGFWLLFTGRTRLQLTLRKFRPDLNAIWRLVKVGIPASITNMERNLGQFALMWFVVPFGTLAVAAHSVGQRVDSFIQVPFMTLGTASGVLAGQNLGAHQPERATRTALLAVGLSSVLATAVSVIIWFWADKVAGIFTTSNDWLGLTGVYLRIQVLSYLLFGVVWVFGNVLNGVGDTLAVLVIATLGMWVVQVPLAYLLPRFTNIGVSGVWWAIVAGVVMRSIAYPTYFLLGRWKNKRV